MTTDHSIKALQAIKEWQAIPKVMKKKMHVKNEYYSAVKKSTFESVLLRWMKLDTFIQSEVSQKMIHQ